MLCVQRRRELRVCAVSSFLNAVVAVANPQPQRRQTWLAAPFHHTYHRNGEHSHLTLSDRPASPWPVPTVSFATAPLLCTLLPLQPLNLRYDIVSHTHTHTPAFRVGVQYDTARRIRHPATPSNLSQFLPRRDMVCPLRLAKYTILIMMLLTNYAQTPTGRPITHLLAPQEAHLSPPPHQSQSRERPKNGRRRSPQIVSRPACPDPAWRRWPRYALFALIPVHVARGLAYLLQAFSHHFERCLGPT